MTDESKPHKRDGPRSSVRSKPGHVPQQRTEAAALKPPSAEPAPGRPSSATSMVPRMRVDASPPRPPTNWLDQRPDGAFRPPDYRWWLANRLAAGEWVPDSWIDSWVLRAEELLTTPPSPWLDAPDLRALAAARDLYERGPSWQRIEVEARLLAGETIEAIAAKTGVSIGAVVAFAALFFAVADRIESSGYVLHVVLRLYAPGNESDIGVQARLLGYTAGSHVLDAVLDSVDRPGVRPDEDVSAENRELRNLARLALGLRMTSVTESNAVVLARLYFLMRECKMLGAKLG